MEKFRLWETDKGNDTVIEYYKPLQKTTDISIVIFPGGGYKHLAKHEGEAYANFLNTRGITAFVVNYSVAPHSFPTPLLDARRAIRFVRSKADEFGINKNKVLAMGSSAGGHLTALLCNYHKDIGEIRDNLYEEPYLPNGQILCYPVISSDENIFHKGSFENLLKGLYNKKEEFSPELLVKETTPPAFIWHTAEDEIVSCINSFRYAESLAKHNIPFELHVFPNGYHGLGLALQQPHAGQWTSLLNNWLKSLFKDA